MVLMALLVPTVAPAGSIDAATPAGGALQHAPPRNARLIQPTEWRVRGTKRYS